MERIVIKLTHLVKRRFRHPVNRMNDAELKTRYLIILHSAQAYSRRNITKMLLCSRSTVGRNRNGVFQEGEEGLIDRRGDNGRAKVNEDNILALLKAVEGSPLGYGYEEG